MYLCYSELDRGYYCRKNVNLEELVWHMKNWGVSFANETAKEQCQEIRETSAYAVALDIVKERYILIYLTRNLIGDISALIELDTISRLVQENKIKVYTLLDGVSIHELPLRLKWLSATQIFTINSNADMYTSVYRVIKDCLSDKVRTNRYMEWRKKLPRMKLWDDDYILRMMDVCNEIVDYGMAMRLAVLYTLYNYIRIQLDQDSKQELYTDRVMKSLIGYTEVCIPTAAVQLEIAEYCMTVLVNCLESKKLSRIEEQ